MFLNQMIYCFDYMDIRPNIDNIHIFFFLDYFPKKNDTFYTQWYQSLFMTKVNIFILQDVKATRSAKNKF